MDPNKKIQIKTYTRGKHTMTLMGVTGAVTQGECQIAEVTQMIAERREQIDLLRKQISDLQERKAEAQAALTGYRQALKEKR